MAGLDPAIHVFARRENWERGSPRQARSWHLEGGCSLDCVVAGAPRN